MYPSLFMLGMKYMSRIIRKVGDFEEFKHYDNCKNLKLNHLCFAYDVLMFSKGEFIPIYKMFQGGSMPFTYLGMSIKLKKISTQDCQNLVETMTSKIKSWSTRALSFAGRVILVNYVLMTFHAYWSHITVLPKQVFKDINAICRAYLWTGKTYNQSAGNISWHKVCKSKQEGCLGFTNSKVWNVAVIGKYVCYVARKKDNVRIKWVNQVYLKEAGWWDYGVPSYGSWYWKKIMEVKDSLKTKKQYIEKEKYNIK
ncbi:unnamed protein product [Vicia faba]|uniref:Uncharacterized protein n=1 Tax=Vicia faba TaxID=3906 RepID=A0AAV0YQL1_VICFA|nr:unnamed protein product [Vicia faba]